MSLSFDASNRYVNIGSDTSLDDLDPVTIMAWVKVVDNSLTTTHIFDKVITGWNGYLVLQILGTTQEIVIGRDGSTSDLYYDTSDTPVVLNKWLFVAGRADLGTGAGIFVGDLDTVASESTYSTSNNGGGSVTTEASATAYIGNHGLGFTRPIEGDIAFCAINNAYLTDAQIKAQQFNLWSSVDPSSCVLFMHLGFAGDASQTQPDWSGNGNNGTVTGATIAPHVPLPVFPPTPYMLPVRHPKGAWSQVCASTPYDVAGMLLSVNADGNGGNSSLIDIGIGSANNEKVLAEDILVGQKDDSGVTLHQVLPLHIKEGERVSVRGSTNAASKNMYPQLTFFANSFMAEQPFARATTYGADSYNSKGTTVDPGGTVNTKGAWSELTPSTNVPMKALILFASNNQSTDTTATRQAVDIGIGAGGSEKVLIPNIQLGVANEHTVSPSVGPFRVDLPAGTRIAVRSQSNNTTSGQREWDCVIVGLD